MLYSENQKIIFRMCAVSEFCLTYIIVIILFHCYVLCHRTDRSKKERFPGCPSPMRNKRKILLMLRQHNMLLLSLPFCYWTIQHSHNRHPHPNKSQQQSSLLMNQEPLTQHGFSEAFLEKKRKWTPVTSPVAVSHTNMPQSSIPLRRNIPKQTKPSSQRKTVYPTSAPIQSLQNTSAYSTTIGAVVTILNIIIKTLENWGRATLPKWCWFDGFVINHCPIPSVY